MFTKFRQQTQIATLIRKGLYFLRTVVFWITAPCCFVGGESTHHTTGVIMQSPQS
jgi:hypothetical protein